jgi:hypothetical protein
MISTRNAVLPCALGALLLSNVTASAATCAAAPITARGEASRFEWLAKTKARANWRARVRAMPNLGGAYANWNAAANPDYTCKTDARRITCVATARPCTR